MTDPNILIKISLTVLIVSWSGIFCLSLIYKKLLLVLLWLLILAAVFIPYSAELLGLSNWVMYILEIFLTGISLLSVYMTYTGCIKKHWFLIFSGILGLSVPVASWMIINCINAFNSC